MYGFISGTDISRENKLNGYSIEKGSNMYVARFRLN